MYQGILCGIILAIVLSCSSSSENLEDNEILGYEILDLINGHWVGSNDTPFGVFEWFTFDFRPISASHSHSIYEGGTNRNIINSIFIADFGGKQQIMARNGGWLGDQYRATYFVMDSVRLDQNTSYFRLVDAVGGVDRAFMEFIFDNNSLNFKAYKDNSGALDKPILHMDFKGVVRNTSFYTDAKSYFGYPKKVSEIDLNGKLDILIDNDSALFLEENLDPFPKSKHGYLSDLSIQIEKNPEAENQNILLYISTQSLISETFEVDYDNIENTVVRTIPIRSDEVEYISTYLHPDDYFLTLFVDQDGNDYPSSGDFASHSVLKKVNPESVESTTVKISRLIP